MRPLCVLSLLFLAGCNYPPSASQTSQSVEKHLVEIASAKINPVTPGQVAEVFALGSEFTELQRDILRKELVGSVVEWEIPVYEVSYEEGVYKVTTLTFGAGSGQAVNMLRAVVFIYPSGDMDHTVLRKVKTNDKLKVRGAVQDVLLRTAVVISPASLVIRPQ